MKYLRLHLDKDSKDENGKYTVFVDKEEHKISYPEAHITLKDDDVSNMTEALEKIRGTEGIVKIVIE